MRLEFWLLLLISLLIIGVLVYQGILRYTDSKSTIKINEEKVYQGPVPEWADEKIFRETGKTVRRE